MPLFLIAYYMETFVGQLCIVSDNARSECKSSSHDYKSTHTADNWETKMWPIIRCISFTILWLKRKHYRHYMNLHARDQVNKAFLCNADEGVIRPSLSLRKDQSCTHATYVWQTSWEEQQRYKCVLDVINVHKNVGVTWVRGLKFLTSTDKTFRNINSPSFYNAISVHGYSSMYLSKY